MTTVVDNIITNYKIFPCQNSKETLLILHGWKGSLLDWEFVACNISNSINVITIDLPGFGQTQWPTLPWDIFDYANFVENFIKKLEVKNISILGHSFGGRIAIILASKNICEKIILVDSAGLNIGNLRTTILKIGSKIGTPFLKLLPKKYKDLAIKAFGSDDYKTAGELTETFKKVILSDLSEYARKINLPTLIIWGEKDRLLPISHGLKLKNLIKNATLKIVWGSNHWPHQEKPQSFIEIVEEFI